jgi:protein-tyrosine phosphatase
MKFKLQENLILNHEAVQQQRRLPFSGAKNFRDLGGYRTMDNKIVRRGVLYRSDALNKLTDRDLQFLSSLNLHQIVDFRSGFEKEREADRLPVELVSRVVEISILDNSTEMFRGSRDELVNKIRQVDPEQFMLDANKEFASRFTPEMRKFIEVVMSSDGRPVLFHCTAGKDRTGFAAAILLRILGVPHDVVMDDYLLTNKYFVTGYRWTLILLHLVRGRQLSRVIEGFMTAKREYLSVAFETINNDHGSFENYICNGLGLAEKDVEHLKLLYLEESD